MTNACTQAQLRVADFFPTRKPKIILLTFHVLNLGLMNSARYKKFGALEIQVQLSYDL